MIASFVGIRAKDFNHKKMFSPPIPAIHVYGINIDSPKGAM